MAVGAALAELAWRYFSKGLLVYGSGLISSFCLLVAGAVWALRDRIDDAVDGEHYSASEYRRMVLVAAQSRRRFTWRASRVALCALAAASAAIAEQLAGDVWHWMVILAGLAAADASYAYLLANSWDEQIRAARSKRIFDAKRDAERKALLERLSRESELSTTGEGWTHDNSWASRPHH